LTEVIGQPIYQRIADTLRAQISSGELAVGDALPSTRKLMEIHRASNNVVRNAVELLRQEGLIHGQPGKAVYVRATPKAVEEERATLTTVGNEVVELREQVERLAEHQPSEVIAKVEELRTEVGRLQEDLRLLYNRLGQPYPRHQDPKPKRRKSGA
jgi:Transcriptional regulators containing a DNA-binding HTH domain and an aminotransferase domain (MocR family) and their eukaryotic orthologs